MEFWTLFNAVKQKIKTMFEIMSFDFKTTC